MATYATPGVIIEEITGPGVIAGVGTSTAGFIGPALAGPLNTPTRITSWEEFVSAFGEVQPDGTTQVYIGDPRSYLANAIQGFFDNGGAMAWIVRVGTAARARRDLDPVTGAGSAIRIEALEEGVQGDNITVAVAAMPLAANRVATRPSATITDARGNKVVVNDASGFKPGDIVTRSTTTERQVIDRIDYTTNEIFLTGSLVGTYTSGTLRMDTLKQGQRTIRLEQIAGPKPGTTDLHAGSVVRIEQTGAASPAETAIVAAVRDDVIVLEKGLTGEFGMASSDNDTRVTSQEFTLTIQPPGAPPETYPGLSMSPRHPGFYERAVVSPTVRAIAPPTPASASPPGNNPNAPVTEALERGSDDDLRAIGATQFQAGIDAFEPIDDVNFICMPDVSDPALQAELVDHCNRKQDRLTILHVAAGRDVDGALAHRSQVGDERGFGALYYPWATIRDPLSPTGDLMLCPPDGHIAGVYARVDTERGVHKAPANETLRGTLGLERLVTDTQQDPLNTEGVNAIRTFPGLARPIVWGARTTVRKDISDWKYVNVRRLLCYIEESLQEGLRWAVFEPNDIALWQKLIRVTTAFLTGVWRDGALFGATAEEAFSVRCDAALNPPESRALGRLFIEIRVAPVRPAEFIVVRISLWDGGSSVAE